MRNIGICIDCEKEKTIFGIKRCRSCYREYKESFAPKKKCECSPDCDTMIVSWDESGNPRRFALHHSAKGSRNSSWKGGRFKRGGYKYIKNNKHPQADKDGYVANHRQVYEEFHKCCLLPWIEIHHIIPIKDGGTDGISNLQPINRSEHQKIHNPRKGYRKDLSGRVCIVCKSDKTGIKRATGQPHWCLHPITKEEWVCQNCYKRLVRSVRKPARRIEERVCVKCGTNKSESRLGYLTWSKTVDGITCKSCYDKSRRSNLIPSNYK